MDEPGAVRTPPACEREKCRSPDTSHQRSTADQELWHCKTCSHTFTVPVLKRRMGGDG